VDCNWGRANRDVSDRYGIRGYPTVVFADPEGNEIDRMRGRTPDAIIGQIESVATKFPGGGVAWLPSIADGRKAADKASKPVVILFTDEGDDAKATEKAFGEKELAELRSKVVLVRHKIDPECDDCKEHKVKEGCCVLILFPVKEGPRHRHEGALNVDAAKQALETALKTWKDLQERDY
jgi:hypothetical protein